MKELERRAAACEKKMGRDDEPPYLVVDEADLEADWLPRLAGRAKVYVSPHLMNWRGPDEWDDEPNPPES